MQRQHVRELLDRYLAGNASAQDRKLVNTWYERMAGQRSLGADQEFDHLHDELWAGSRRIAGLKPLSKKRSLWPVITIAAILLAILSVSTLFWTTHHSDNQKTQQVVDIPAGGNRATLTLSDGQTIRLRESQAGIVVQNGIKYLDGSTVFGEQVSMGTSEQGKTATREPVEGPERNHKLTGSQIHTLTTPKGGTYRITLPDGSRVWLNAASTLKYPGRFSGKERVVEVTGEAYFSVTHNPKQPFKVLSDGQEIRVVGTDFNLSAYPDEPETKTTLVEGAIQIVNHQAETVNKLSPGEQAVVSDASTDIYEVRTEDFTAWKDGAFVFGAKSFTATMRDVARWYDIDVVYQTQQSPENIRIGGWVARGKPLSSIIHLLEMTGSVHTQLTGRRLTIMD